MLCYTEEKYSDTIRSSPSLPGVSTNFFECDSPLLGEQYTMYAVSSKENLFSILPNSTLLRPDPATIKNLSKMGLKVNKALVRYRNANQDTWTTPFPLENNKYDLWVNIMSAMDNAYIPVPLSLRKEIFGLYDNLAKALQESELQKHRRIGILATVIVLMAIAFHSLSSIGSLFLMPDILLAVFYTTIMSIITVSITACILEKCCSIKNDTQPSNYITESDTIRSSATIKSHNHIELLP